MKAMKIGLLGGTFDPIHVGHLIIAERAREALDLDRVIFIPAGRPPHRPAPAASAPERLEMVRLAIAGNEAFTFSEIELGRSGPSFTYETVRALASEYGAGHEWHLILGLDAFREIGTWHRVEELARLVRFAVADRPGFQPPEQLPPGVRCQRLELGLFPVSGREIRERAARGESVRYLVTDSVYRYISSRRLYRPDEVRPETAASKRS